MSTDVSATRWQPWWASAIAFAGLVLAGALTTAGIVAAWNDYFYPKPWIGIIGWAFDLPVIAAGVSIGGPWGLFLIKGGRQSFTVGAVAAGLIGLVAIWLLIRR